MAIFVNTKNIETDNLIMGLYMGADIKHTENLYNRYDLKLDDETNKLIRYISKTKKIDREMLNKLFKRFPRKGRDTDLFNFVSNWKEISYGKDLEEFLSHMENIEEDMILNNIYIKLLRMYRDKEYVKVDKEDIDIKDIINMLKKVNISTEFKWYIVEVASDVKGFFLKCSEFFRNSKEALKKKLMPLDIKGRQWGTDLKKRIEKEGFNMIKPLLDDFDEYEYKNIYLSPRIIDNYAFDNLTMSNGEDVCMFIGYNVECLNDKYGLNNERNWTKNILKNLSDDSRFKIILLIKDKPRYASELAEELNITNATITHHITILHIIKLLQEIKDKGRIYHKIREDSIIKFVEVLKRDFKLKEVKVTNINIDKENLFEIIKCLSDHSRYEMLKYLTNKKMYGGELGDTMDLSGGTISHHIKILLSSDLVIKERIGNRVYYSVNKEILANWVNGIEKKFI